MIRVNEEYVIDVDENSYALYRDFGKTTKRNINGREFERKQRKALGYYSTLQKALQAIVNCEVRKYTSEGEKSLYNVNVELKSLLAKWERIMKAAIPEAEVTVSEKSTD